MSDDLERRLRASLSTRAADPLAGHEALPAATRRRARTRRAANALTAAVTGIAVVAGGVSLISRRVVEPAPVTLPAASPTRVPEPAASIPPAQAPAPRLTPAQSATDRVADVPDAGAKIVAHDRMWVVATTRVLSYSLSGRLRERIVISQLVGSDAVLEPRIVAADDAGVWVAGAGASAVAATAAAGSCTPVDALGGDRPGEAFVMRIDAATACPSVFIKLGSASDADEPAPSPILPATATPAPGSRPRYVRWHGLAAAAGSLWIGADGGMLRADLASGTLESLGLDAYSVGAGFGSVWAAVVQDRGTPDEDAFIARIDPASGQVSASIDVPPADPATTTDFAEVHVGPDAVWAEGWGIVAQIDPATNGVVARYRIGGRHLMGDMASADGSFYLADNGPTADGVWVIDAVERRLVRKIATGSAVSGIAVTGGRVWFSRNGAIERISVR